MDARNLSDIVPKDFVDVTITSPPYYDLKDYGSKRQIGYGQEYDTYLKDLGDVFKNVYDCTKATGSLWVIIDSFRRDGEVVPLPFDFSNEITKSGWKLQDVIIWAKDRTVPWAKKGQMRSLFEYILLFSKSNDFVFNIDRVRTNNDLKKWWVKYPERYNPNGKAPDGIWKFDIPVQGSWGNGFIRHFCPLPEEMIAQVLRISTNEDDVVLDPFSGSGAVLAKAHSMRRRYIGLELNRRYIGMFNRYLKESGLSKTAAYEKENSDAASQEEFYRTVVNLRALKFAKVLAKKIKQKRIARISKIYVRKSSKKVKKKNALLCVEYVFWVENPNSVVRLQNYVDKISSVPPLSKFGIDFKFKYVSGTRAFVNRISEKRLYTYNELTPYRYERRIDTRTVADSENDSLIVSGIRVKANEKDAG